MFGRNKPTPLKIEVDFQQIVDEADQRSTLTPDIYDLAEALMSLKKADPVNYRLTRMQLRWLINRVRRDHGKNWPCPF